MAISSHSPFYMDNIHAIQAIGMWALAEYTLKPRLENPLMSSDFLSLLPGIWHMCSF